ncbi:MAG: putative acetyl-hydrolase LipR, partial [Phenylobacterium sp.]|nr:putative acetyl-hydrolase LipR [Phenylobacterium sp.]
PRDVLSLLPPRRSGPPPGEELMRRRVAGAGLGAQPTHPTVVVSTETVAGIDCVICTPPERRGDIVYLHGGGYRVGSAAAWRGFGSRLAAASRLRVLLPEYGLAPEAPFPCALHDALAVLQALSEANGRGLVLVGGDSAGGGLALASALALAAAGAPLAGAILISPWLDLTNQAASFATCAATDPLFSKASADAAAETYLQGWSNLDPWASPLYGDLAAAPPVLVLASAAEVLLQDSLSLAVKLAEAGRPVRLHVAAEQVHVWPVLRSEDPASEAALAAIGDFVTAATRR